MHQARMNDSDSHESVSRRRRGDQRWLVVAPQQQQSVSYALSNANPTQSLTLWNCIPRCCVAALAAD